MPGIRQTDESFTAEAENEALQKGVHSVMQQHSTDGELIPKSFYMNSEWLQTPGFHQFRTEPDTDCLNAILLWWG